MNFNVKSVILLIAIICLRQQTGFSQADTAKLEKPISILNKKVFFNFPASAVVSPRVADIMAADPNENRETRIIMDNGKMRLVFFAQELFAYSGNSLFEDISAEIEPDFNFTRRILVNSDSLLTIISTPSIFDSTASAILVNTLLIKSPDNTVSRIDVYINPDACTQKKEYIKIYLTPFPKVPEESTLLPG
jgi:hypothetical protein